MTPPDVSDAAVEAAVRVAPPKNWCPTCDRRPKDPMAVFCSDPFHRETRLRTQENAE